MISVYDVAELVRSNSLWLQTSSGEKIQIEFSFEAGNVLPKVRAPISYSPYDYFWFMPQFEWKGSLQGMPIFSRIA